MKKMNQMNTKIFKKLDIHEFLNKLKALFGICQDMYRNTVKNDTKIL